MPPYPSSAGSSHTSATPTTSTSRLSKRFLPGLRFFHDRRGRLHRPARRSLPRSTASSDVTPELLGVISDGSFRADSSRSQPELLRRTARQVPATRFKKPARSIAGSSQPRRVAAHSFPEVSMDETDCRANSGRIADHSRRHLPMRAFPSRPSPQSSAAASIKACRLRRRLRSVRSRDGPRHGRNPACRLRPMGYPPNLKLSVHSGQRQVLDLPRHPRSDAPVLRWRPPQDRGHHLA
jgi:hypothetical protein